MDQKVTTYISTTLGLPLQDEYMDHTRAMFDTGSVETDTGELYYAMVKMVHPLNVLETGSYKGISAAYIALGLKDNGQGHLDSVEWEAQHLQLAKERWIKLGLQGVISEYQMNSLDFTPTVGYDMMFLDTEPQCRFSELRRFWQYLKPGGYVVIHDLHEHLGESKIPWEDWKDFEDLTKQVQWISFPTKRGIMIGQKNREGMAYI